MVHKSIIGRIRLTGKAQVCGYNPGMSQQILCDLCGQPIPPHAHYVVQIDVFADPATAKMDTNDLGESSIAKLMEELKHLSADELQDQVHRRFEYKICRPCQRKVLVNPLGRPRSSNYEKN
jgi:hypothetical protein